MFKCRDSGGTSSCKENSNNLYEKNSFKLIIWIHTPLSFGELGRLSMHPVWEC